jgi:hypothetical protein
MAAARQHYIDEVVSKWLDACGERKEHFNLHPHPNASLAFAGMTHTQPKYRCHSKDHVSSSVCPLATQKEKHRYL